MQHTASGGRQGKDLVPVNVPLIDAQLAALAAHPVLPEPAALPPRTRLLLTWPAGSAAGPRALGLYAKWLVAARLLFELADSTADLKTLLAHNRNADLRELFDPSYDKRQPEPAWFDPTERSDRHQHLHALLERLLDRLNEGLRERGRPEIALQDFVGQEVLLQPGCPVVGRQPLRRWRDWLLHRVTLPNPPWNDPGGTDIAPALQVAARAYVAEHLADDPHREPHRVVYSLFGSADDQQLQQAFGAAVRRAIAATADTVDTPFLPVLVSLAPGTTRRSVLEALDRQICGGPGELPDLDHRAIDLATDLQQVRETLTVGRIVVIFHGWDNTAGPFAALRDFVCDTPWAELIRCLAHPVHGLLADGSPGMPSRIVVLSGRPVEELAPWTRHAQPLPCMPPGASPHGAEPDLDAFADMRTRYLVDAEAAARLRAAGHRLPPMPDSGLPGELAPYLPVALRLVAASLDGMQPLTLQRCLSHWVTLFGWTAAPAATKCADARHETQLRIDAAVRALDDPASFERFVDALLDRHRALLMQVPGERVEGLSPATRELALHRRPVVGAAVRDPDQVPMNLQFRSRASCALAVRAWLGEPGTAASPGHDVADWRRINFVLGEEALRQATAQMRHLGHNVRESAQSSRKLMQAVYHCLACHDLDVQPAIDGGFLEGSRSATCMPLEARRRYRYLYAFVYRQCIEGGDWRLGRGYGRSDLRLDLLTLFVQPHRTHWAVCGPPPGAQERVLPQPFELEPALPDPDPLLRSDLLEALGRAGLDAGLPMGREATRWVLTVLPGWRLPLCRAPSADPRQDGERHDINSRLPRRDAGYQRVADAALKLRLDWLQSSGSDDALALVQQLCDEQLQRMGIDPAVLQPLSDEVPAALTQAGNDTESATERLSRTLRSVFMRLRAHARSYAETLLLSDLLYRLAEAKATDADNRDFHASLPADGPASGSRAIAAARFAQACALYWVADRLRAHADAREPSGVRWPIASARPTRYYIRVCMKLARLMLDSADGRPSRRAKGVAHALMDLAQSRLGLFTRHHFRFDRERVSGLLLESARIRSWARIDAEHEYREYRQHSISLLDRLSAVTVRLDGLEQALLKAQMELALAERSRRRSPSPEQVPLDALQQQADRCRADVADATAAQADMEHQLAALQQRFVHRLGQLQQILDRSLAYLGEAEKTLLALGFQRHHVRRLFLERIKFGSARARLLLLPDNADATESSEEETEVERRWRIARAAIETELARLMSTHRLHAELDLARTYLDALGATCAGDEFWTHIHERQRLGFQALESRVARVQSRPASAV